MAENDNIQLLPLVPLKNSVLFPNLLMPLSVGRAASLAAVEAALATEEKEIVVVAQRDAGIDEPKQDDLYTIGTKAVIRKMSRPNEDLMEVLVIGTERVVILKLEETEPFTRARVRSYPVPEEKNAELEALHRALVDLAVKAVGLAQSQQAPQDLTRMIAQNEDGLRLVYLLASMFGMDLQKEQNLLEAVSRADALRLMHSYLSHEVEVLELRNKIASSARSEMSKEQREYLLRQQMRAIQQELGESNPEKAETTMLRERIEKADLPEDVRKEADRELARLERMPRRAARPPGNPHLPRAASWNCRGRRPREDTLDLAHARQVLDEDHYRPQGSEGAHPRTPGRAEAEPRRRRRRSCASSALPALAKRRSASRSPGRWAASSSA